MTVNADEIAAKMMAAGIDDVFVEQLDDASVVLLAGPMLPDTGEGFSRYSLRAGPGWVGHDASWFALNELRFGADDDGQSTPERIAVGDVDAIAATFVAWIRSRAERADFVPNSDLEVPAL